MCKRKILGFGTVVAVAHSYSHLVYVALVLPGQPYDSHL